jgi:hypothetical protein
VTFGTSVAGAGLTSAGAGAAAGCWVSAGSAGRVAGAMPIHRLRPDPIGPERDAGAPGPSAAVVPPRRPPHRACVQCSAELDVDRGEWVADFPERPTHGYRISQLFSNKVDPEEILTEYRTTRFPERFYNLKIGVPWADLDRRLDIMSVLSLCQEREMAAAAERDGDHYMGVDTGKQLHVVILKMLTEGPEVQHLVHLAVCHDFSDLDALMERFRIDKCVIDALPETHATRAFALRHAGDVYLNFFSEHQHGQAQWDPHAHIVTVNRTEALDASRAAIRQKLITLPRRSPVIDEFARHMAADAKVLEEDEETGVKRYRYVRTGEDHYSLAFTYACLAASNSFTVSFREWLRLVKCLSGG